MRPRYSWWRWPCRRHGGSGWRGAAVGALVGLLAHPLAWYLQAVGSWLTGTRDSLGQPAAGPVDALLVAAALSLASWVMAGWVTVPLGAIGGAVLARVLRVPPPPAEGARRAS